MTKNSKSLLAIILTVISYLLMLFMVYSIGYVMTGEYDINNWYFVGRLSFGVYSVLLLMWHAYALIKTFDNINYDITTLKTAISKIEQRLNVITFDMGDSYDDDEIAIFDEICKLEDQRSSMLERLETLESLQDDYPD